MDARLPGLPTKHGPATHGQPLCQRRCRRSRQSVDSAVVAPPVFAGWTRPQRGRVQRGQKSDPRIQILTCLSGRRIGCCSTTLVQLERHTRQLCRTATRAIRGRRHLSAQTLDLFSSSSLLPGPGTDLAPPAAADGPTQAQSNEVAPWTCKNGPDAVIWAPRQSGRSLVQPRSRGVEGLG